MKGSRNTSSVSLSIIAFVLFPISISGQRTTLQPQSSTQAKFKKSARAIPNNYIVVLNDNVVSRAVTADARRAQVSSIADSFAQQHGGKVGFIYETALIGFRSNFQMRQRRSRSVAVHELNTLKKTHWEVSSTLNSVRRGGWTVSIKGHQC
jgi:hypothetical protein